MSDEIEPMLFETSTIEDLVRLAVSVILPAPVQIFHIKEENNKHVYFCMVPTIGFTGSKPVPTFYYIRLEKEVGGPYALIKSDDDIEQIEFSKSTRRGWHAAVIVNLKRTPEKITFP